MANLGYEYDENNTKEVYEIIPTGWYPAMIITSEMKKTKNGSGQYLQLSWQILDGQYKGRTVFDRLNLINPNQEAVRIARQQLDKIRYSTARTQARDSQELHNIPVQIRVKIQPAKGDWEASNVVGNYKPINAQTQQQPQQQSAFVSPGTPPAQDHAALVNENPNGGFAAEAPPWARS